MALTAGTFVEYGNEVQVSWWHMHFFETVKDHYQNVYQECRCGQRRVLFRRGGYQPIDREWLSARNTGFPLVKGV